MASHSCGDWILWASKRVASEGLEKGQSWLTWPLNETVTTPDYGTSALYWPCEAHTEALLSPDQTGPGMVTASARHPVQAGTFKRYTLSPFRL